VQNASQGRCYLVLALDIKDTATPTATSFGHHRTGALHNGRKMEICKIHWTTEVGRSKNWMKICVV